MTTAERVAFTGWGRTSPTVAERIGAPPRGRAELPAPPGRGVVARGLGRSYGDAAQNAGGTVLDCTPSSGILRLDPVEGVVTVLAGTTLDELLRELVPAGWFVPVTPGTRFVTVGGAVASDVHGKNHHVDGTFGAAVTEIELLLGSGELVRLTPTLDSRWFWATVGGMGLTGVIVSVTFRLRRIETSLLSVDTDRADDLDACMALLAEGDEVAPYTVAWIDCLATGRRTGRSVVARGRHAPRAELGPGQAQDPLRYGPREALAAPPVPGGLLNRATVAAFNEMWFRRAPRRRRGELQSIPAFFHPLDLVQSWNRLYGRRGFVQHQSVVPFGAEATLRQIVERFSTAGVASFLAVLKRFGAANPGPLSFPMPGWTLALDIPVGRGSLGPLLDDVDRLVLEAGGRVYLAKDGRAEPAVIHAMYPRLEEWRAVRREMDPTGVLQSDLGRRLRLA